MSINGTVPGADAGTSDAELVERSRRGDTAGFDALVRRHYRAAYVVALSLLGNGMDAEDVCQDAFLKALDRLEECRQPDRFAAWLIQIVRNRAHNYRDYQRMRTGVALELVSPAGVEDSARDAARAELRGRLEQALKNLSEVQRQVVLLHDLEGWRHREIADSLQLSEGMSRQHLFTARRVLRDRLGASALKEYLHE